MVLFNWLSQNKEWVFSGAGLTVIAFVFNLFKKKIKVKEKDSSKNLVIIP